VIIMNSDKNSAFRLPEAPFTGTLATLLPLLKEYPSYVESSKARMHRLIVREGVNELRSEKIQRIFGKDSILAYNAFKDFYGIEPSIHQVVTDFFGAAVKGAEADKQVLVLIGPKGSGKSQFVKRLKDILKGCEPLPFPDACPMHENPLNLLFLVHQAAQLKAKTDKTSAAAARAAIIETLGLEKLLDFNNGDLKGTMKKAGVEPTYDGLLQINEAQHLVSAIVYGLGLPRSTRSNIGHPCPFCQDRVLGKYTDEKVELAEFPIDSFYFADDQEGSVGICSVKEVQPLNYDIRVMIGEEDIAALGNVDRNSPRAVQLNGAYNLGNRGMVEFVEGFKNPKEAHRSVLEATQDKSIPAPDPMRRNLHIDTVIVYHSNAPEFREFANEPKNEPYLDRFVKINFGYPLEYSEAKRVVLKQWDATDFARSVKEGGVHLEPTVAEYLSIFEVLTRIEDDENVPDLMMKLYAYNGDEGRLRGMNTKIDVQALKKNATPYEGMEGISPRFTAKLLTAIASEAQAKGKCVTSREVRDRLYAEIRLIPDEKLQEKYRLFVGKLMDDWRRKKLARVVLAGLVESFKPECQNVFEKYLDNVQAYNRGTSVRGNTSSFRSGPDEDFMRQIESDPDLNITSAQAAKFRAEVSGAVNAWMTEHREVNVPYTCFEPLKNAIERFVSGQAKNVARILSSSTSRSDEDNRKLKGVLDRLIRDHGFCGHCAEEVLKEAEETRDFLKEV
jgi:serine protein kinase